MGYKVQVSETVPETQGQKGEPTAAFITAVHTQPASENDGRSLDAVRSSERESGLEAARERYVDSAYVSGEQMRIEQQAGGKLMGPMLTLKAHPSEVQGFVIATDGREATCPAGHRNESVRVCRQTRYGRTSTYHRLVWHRCCRGCQRRQACVGEREERFVMVRADYSLIRSRRAEQRTIEFRQQMHRRNAIEGTISELVRRYGLRHSRYRGKAKASLANWLIAAACNTNRWLKRLQYAMHGPAASAMA